MGKKGAIQQNITTDIIKGSIHAKPPTSVTDPVASELCSDVNKILDEVERDNSTKDRIIDVSDESIDNNSVVERKMTNAVVDNNNPNVAVAECETAGEVDADNNSINETDLETDNTGDDEVVFADSSNDGSDNVAHSPDMVDFDNLMKRKKFSLFCKRAFDIFASLFGLILLSPILLIVALIIVLTSKGGVFFRQIRVGKNGKEFRIFKFRTMVKNAETKGMQITVGKDARVTAIGKILRKCKIDELPQLINVLIGQMSFVGYRPEVPKYVAMYTHYQRNVLRIRPGITDLASIEYRDESEVLANADDPEKAYVEDVMQKKLDLNIRYMQKMGFWYDIGIIFRTFLAILK